MPARVPPAVPFGLCSFVRRAMRFPSTPVGASVLRVIALFKKPVAVRGHVIPARRYTGWALIYVLVFVGLPVTVIGLMFDLVGWAITVKLLGADCYGIGCLFD